MSLSSSDTQDKGWTWICLSQVSLCCSLFHRNVKHSQTMLPLSSSQTGKHKLITAFHFFQPFVKHTSSRALPGSGWPGPGPASSARQRLSFHSSVAECYLHSCVSLRPPSPPSMREARVPLKTVKSREGNNSILCPRSLLSVLHCFIEKAAYFIFY